MCLCFLSIHTAVIQAVRSVAFQLLNLAAFQLLNLAAFQLLKLKLMKGNPSSRVSIVPGTRQKPFAFSACGGEGYRGKRDRRIRRKREGLGEKELKGDERSREGRQKYRRKREKK